MADRSKTSTNIREKAGIDYLIPQSQRPESTAGIAPDAGVERALAVYGHRILEMLHNAPEKSSRVFEIVDATGLDIATVQGVVDRMVRTDLLQIDETDKYGNHRIRITPVGERML